MTEPARNLCRYLFVGSESVVPQTIDWSRHASATIQLQRSVELPDAERRLVAGGDETLITAGERLLHEFAAIGTFHVVESPGSSEFKTLDDGIGSVNLEGIGI